MGEALGRGPVGQLVALPIGDRRAPPVADDDPDVDGHRAVTPELVVDVGAGRQRRGGMRRGAEQQPEEHDQGDDDGTSRTRHGASVGGGRRVGSGSPATRHVIHRTSATKAQKRCDSE